MDGSRLIIQYGKEDEYGEEIGTATRQIEVGSETFKYVPNKVEEGLLTGSKIGGKVNTMSKSAEGGISTLARPDDIGLFLMAMTGTNPTPVLVEGSTGAYTRTFTLTNADHLPTLFFKVLRETGIAKGYTGLMFDGLSFNVQAGDTLKMDMTMKGKAEVDTTMETGLSISPLKPFRLDNAIVKVGGTPLEVFTTKFEMKSNLNASLQSNHSGIYLRKPTVGRFDLITEFETDYNTVSNTLRNLYWLTDDIFSAEITFFNGSNIEEGFPYSLKISLPTNQMTDNTVNISGQGPVKIPIKLKAVENGVEPISITLVNGYNQAY